MSQKKYTYKDFVTGKIRRTGGKFIGWSEPTGPLIVAIDAEKYGIKRQQKRDMISALAQMCGATSTNPRG